MRDGLRRFMFYVLLAFVSSCVVFIYFCKIKKQQRQEQQQQQEQQHQHCLLYTSDAADE